MTDTAPTGRPAFTCDRRPLAELLKFVARAVPNRPTVPALAAIQVTVGDEHVTLSAFDYEVSHAGRIPAVVDTPGQVLVPGQLLRDLVHSAAGAQVKFDDTGKTVELRSGRASMRLPVIGADDYPDLPSMPPVVGEVDAEVLRRLVDTTAWAASKEDLESIRAIRGVHITGGDDTLHLESTDRFSLVHAEASWVGKGTVDATIPATQLVAALTGLTGTVRVACDEGRAAFTTDTRSVTMRLLDADYPDLARLYPGEEQMVAWAEVDAADMAAAAKRVAHAAEKNTSMVVTVDPAGVVSVVAGSSTDPTSATDEVDADVTADQSDGPWQVAFTPTFFANVIDACGTPRIRFGLNAGSLELRKPSLFLPVDDTGAATVTAVLMPRRLNPGEKR